MFQVMWRPGLRPLSTNCKREVLKMRGKPREAGLTIPELLLEQGRRKQKMNSIRCLHLLESSEREPRKYRRAVKALRMLWRGQREEGRESVFSRSTNCGLGVVLMVPRPVELPFNSSHNPMGQGISSGPSNRW